jgi:hypothetical protein
VTRDSVGDSVGDSACRHCRERPVSREPEAEQSVATRIIINSIIIMQVAAQARREHGRHLAQ